MSYVFGQFTPEHLKKMEEGIHLFNEQKYWECHESLEEIWLEDRNDNARYIYWAVIQVAAVCIHYRDKKILGAQGMLSKSKEKFRKARELHVLTPEVEKLNWYELEKIVMNIPDATQSQLEDFRPLFEYRFPA
ncbi:MAG: DUF309 domain-containing protein [Bacteriovoracaceae bacterium]